MPCVLQNVQKYCKILKMVINEAIFYRKAKIISSKVRKSCNFAEKSRNEIFYL